ncbi:unnamed protein product [Brassica oleracea]
MAGCLLRAERFPRYWQESKSNESNEGSTGRSVGVEAQLTHLATITQIIDPKVHYLLETSYFGPHAKIGFSEQMTWALLEYEPDMYSLYEEPHFEGKKMEGSSKGKPKSIT